jgi:FkbM family methyltransferase
MNFISSNGLAVVFNDIICRNDGDVSIACITNESIKDKNAPVCIDIGADIAAWSLFCKYINPTAEIYIFEPNPTSFEIIKKYESDTMHVFNKAVSDTEGTSKMEFNGGQSSLRTNTGISVELTTVDFIFNKHTNIDIIKIDTEGHDLIIVNSLMPYFSRINEIVFEFTVYWHGLTKEECIKNSFNTLSLLKKSYKYMYILSRNGKPRLVHINSSENFIPIILFLYTNHIQVDILVSNIESKNILVYDTVSLFTDTHNTLFHND